jgi:DNA-directed RNA polymerase subunit K/omega
LPIFPKAFDRRMHEMPFAHDPNSPDRLLNILAKLKVGDKMNRYEFAVAAARRGREIYSLLPDGDTKTQQESPARAQNEIISGTTRIEKSKSKPAGRE